MRHWVLHRTVPRWVMSFYGSSSTCIGRGLGRKLCSFLRHAAPRFLRGTFFKDTGPPPPFSTALCVRHPRYCWEPSAKDSSHKYKTEGKNNGFCACILSEDSATMCLRNKIRLLTPRRRLAVANAEGLSLPLQTGVAQSVLLEVLFAQMSLWLRKQVPASQNKALSHPQETKD